jgi:oligogalacturonide lyase
VDPNAPPPPREWIDPDTGHRVIRISDEPGSQSLYFHYNPFTPQGDKMVFSTPTGLTSVDLTTLGNGTPKLEKLIDGPVSLNAASWTTREVYFSSGGSFYSVNFDTHAVTKVYDGRVNVINNDGTIIVNAINATDPTGKTPVPPHRDPIDQRIRMFGDKIAAGIPLTPDEEYAANKENGLAGRAVNPSSMAFVFTNVKTGQSVTTGYQYGSLNHEQFSPTDPTMLLYCHEGTWHEVDRIWTIHTDGSNMILQHPRTMDMEIAGHEFWSYDGKTVWFDLQTPRSKQFWIAGKNIETGKEIHYHVDRDAWGVHYNVSRDNTMFCSDGGDPTQVAFEPNGEWINLFRVQPDGTLSREKLVNMSKHNYVTGRGGLEPNGFISPDKKWVIFRSNMFGPDHVFAVEVAKATTTATK